MAIIDAEAKAFLDANETAIFGASAAYGVAIIVLLVVLLLFGPGLPSALQVWAGGCVVAFAVVAAGLAAFNRSLDDAPNLSAFSKFALCGWMIILAGVAIVWFRPNSGLAAGLMAIVVGSALSSLGLVWAAQIIRTKLFKRN